MKNCTDFIDSISAYADGELTVSEILSVDKHLAECESCSALLEVYREITITVTEAGTEPPEALRIGVMNRVINERSPNLVKNKKNRGHFYFAITRFAPIAACLLVGLLVWQPWVGSSGGGANNVWGLRDHAASPAVTSGSADIPAPAAEASYDLQMNADVDDSDDIEWDNEAPVAGGGTGTTAAPAAPQSRFSISDEEEALSLDGGTRTVQETEQIMEFLGGAHTEFTITGELPARLVGREPLPIGSWFGWEMVFEIPDTEVLILIAELKGRDDVTINAIKNDSTYAIVFYSP